MNSIEHIKDLRHLTRATALGLANELARTSNDETGETLKKAIEHIRAARIYLHSAQHQVRSRWE